MKCWGRICMWLDQGPSMDLCKLEKRWAQCLACAFHIGCHKFVDWLSESHYVARGSCAWVCSVLHHHVLSWQPSTATAAFLSVKMLLHSLCVDRESLLQMCRFGQQIAWKASTRAVAQTCWGPLQQQHWRSLALNWSKDTSRYMRRTSETGKLQMLQPVKRQQLQCSV